MIFSGFQSPEDQIFVLCGGDASSMKTAPWFLEMRWGFVQTWMTFAIGGT